MFLDYDHIPTEPRLFLERCYFNHSYHAMEAYTHQHAAITAAERCRILLCLVQLSLKSLHCEGILYRSKPHEPIMTVASSQWGAAAYTPFCTPMQPGLQQRSMRVRNSSD